MLNVVLCNIMYELFAFTERGFLVVSLPWHKLNHRKQNYYIIVASIALALVYIGIVYLINRV